MYHHELYRLLPGGQNGFSKESKSNHMAVYCLLF